MISYKKIIFFVTTTLLFACEHFKSQRLENPEQLRIFLGVSFYSTPRPLPDNWLNKISYSSALEVRNVNPETPADKAGLRRSDLLVAIDDKPLSYWGIKSFSDFNDHIYKRDRNQAVKLTILRENLNVKVKSNNEVLLEQANVKTIDFSEYQFELNEKKETTLRNSILAEWTTSPEELKLSLNLESIQHSYGELKNFSVVDFSTEGILTQTSDVDLQSFIENSEQKESLLKLKQSFNLMNTSYDSQRLNLVALLHQDPIKITRVSAKIAKNLDSLNSNVPFSGLSELLMQTNGSTFSKFELPRLRSKIDQIVYAQKKSDAETAKVFSALNANQLKRLKNQIYNLVSQFTDHIYIHSDGDRNRFHYNYQTIKDLLKIDSSYFLKSTLIMSKILNEAFFENLKSEAFSHLKKSNKNQIRITSPLGVVLISDETNHKYLGSHLKDVFLIIDLGGSDFYGDIKANIIDFEGNDSYESSYNWSLGSAEFRTSYLIDLSGNDRYISRYGSFGSSLFGAAYFWDAKGDDIYRCQAYCFASAFGGVALFVDSEGNDQYHGMQFTQAVGIAGGFAVLADFAGDDNYYSKGLSPTSYGDHGQFEGWSQGVGIGFRGYMSGGFGLLYDRSGEDQYEAGNFSQGGGYYFGIGMLYDSGEQSDAYTGSRYTQGFSAHNAIGIFREKSGNDTYRSRDTVSQGIAWDWSLSLFEDFEGDDTHQTCALCLGGAAQSSMAFFIDHNGQDNYEGPHLPVRSEEIPNDYQPSAKVSFGLFLDSGNGKDTYQSFKNNSIEYRKDYQVLQDK